MKIRRANIEDVELIHQLGGVCFRSTYGDILSDKQMEYMLDMMYSQPNIALQMEQLGHCYYIGYIEAQPFGYISIEREAEGLYHLQKIYLLPDYQRKGLGRSLFEFATKTVCEDAKGKCKMELNVNRGNHRALEFYKKMGMHCDRSGDFEIGEGYYMNDHIMAIELNG